MTIKLYYFNAYGRAEAIRMLLNKANVDFEDRRIEWGSEEWKALKESGKLEYGQGPALELDYGTMLCQTNAVLDYLAQTYGFSTHSAMEAYKCQHLIYLYQEDYGKHSARLWMAKPEDKPAVMDEIASTHFPALAGHLTRKLVDGKTKFLVADHLTTADFIVGGFFTNTVCNPNNAFAAKWTEAWEKCSDELKAYVAAFQEELKDYLASRPVCTM